MFIQTNENNDIIQLITVGCKPTENGYEISNDTPEDILKNIFSYKYIDGQFVYKTEVDETKLNKVKESKLKALSSCCNTQIEKGIDFNGSHYSLTRDDQINIMSLSSDAQVAMLMQTELSEPLMYHADGEECRVFASEEIMGIATLSKKYIKYHTTYFNLIKQQIMNMTSIEDILTINYGQELSSENEVKLSEVMGGDPSTYGFNTELIEDKTDYKMIIQDIDLDKLTKPQDVVIEEDVTIPEEPIEEENNEETITDSESVNTDNTEE